MCTFLRGMHKVRLVDRSLRDWKQDKSVQEPGRRKAPVMTIRCFVAKQVICLFVFFFLVNRVKREQGCGS
jgi:hypothetical protein